MGGVFDPEKRRFDHHQKTFTTHWWEEKDKLDKEMADSNPEALTEVKDPKEAKEPKEHTTKLSSAGLVYKYYGKEVIKNMCKLFYDLDLSDGKIDELYEKLYKSLIMEIDAIDNGVNQADSVKYSISTGLSSRIGNYNSPWNAPADAKYSQHS